MSAQAPDSALRPRYARLHAAWQTPWAASAVTTALGIVLLLSSTLPTVNQTMKDSVNAIGIQAAFYYARPCFACAWNARRSALRHSATGAMLVLWPVASAVFLAYVAVDGIPTSDVVSHMMGIGGIVVGLVPLFLNRLRMKRNGGG
jgi:hypothetical protein